MVVHVYYLSGNYDLPYDEGQIGYGRDLGDCAVILVGEKVGVVDFGAQTFSLQNFLQEKNIKKIDFCVISHYHSDHIGGKSNGSLSNFIEKNPKIFDECIFYLPHHLIDWNKYVDNKKKEFSTYFKNVETNIKKIAKNIIYPEEGQKIVLNEETFLTFYNLTSEKFNYYYEITTPGDELWPDEQNPHTSYNNFSMITVLSHLNYNYLFSGDIEEKAQELNANDLPKIDIYKVEHHGLNYSTNRRYLEKINPKVTIIETYKRQYGNIHSRLASFGVTQAFNKGSIVYETIKSGRVHVITNEYGIASESATGQTLKIGETTQTLYYNNLIELGADLNNFLESGNYYSPDKNYSKTLKNCPIDNSFLLKIYNGSGSSLYGIVQELEPTFTDIPRTYRRVYKDTKNGWSQWQLVNNFLPKITDKVKSYQNRSNNIKGGYQQIGNLTYVDISFNNLIKVPSYDYFTMVTGLPKPVVGETLLTAMRKKDSKRFPIVAWITEGGSICIQDGWSNIDINQIIHVSGVYLSK